MALLIWLTHHLGIEEGAHVVLLLAVHVAGGAVAQLLVVPLGQLVQGLRPPGGVQPCVLRMWSRCISNVLRRQQKLASLAGPDVSLLLDGCTDHQAYRQGWQPTCSMWVGSRSSCCRHSALFIFASYSSICGSAASLLCSRNSSSSGMAVWLTGWRPSSHSYGHPPRVLSPTQLQGYNYNDS